MSGAFVWWWKARLVAAHWILLRLNAVPNTKSSPRTWVLSRTLNHLPPEWLWFRPWAPFWIFNSSPNWSMSQTLSPLRFLILSRLLKFSQILYLLQDSESSLSLQVSHTTASPRQLPCGETPPVLSWCPNFHSTWDAQMSWSPYTEVHRHGNSAAEFMEVEGGHSIDSLVYGVFYFEGGHVFVLCFVLYPPISSSSWEIIWQNSIFPNVRIPAVYGFVQPRSWWPFVS